jgi:protein-S-isoprenylcysteine O-methyltransferase Ste14
MLLSKATVSMTDQRRHSKPKFAVVLILLLFVLLSLLHPAHLGNASAVCIVLATCFLFGIVQVATCRWRWEEAQFLPRVAFRSALFDRPPPFLSV